MAHADRPLAEALRAAVVSQDFATTPDRLLNGAPLRHFPSIDLAVACFAEGRPPRWANVLFSREHPEGFVADIDAHAAGVRNVRFERDLQGPDGTSIAWLPDADWNTLRLQRLHGQGSSFVAPYPASLLKLMVAVGVGLAIDAGLQGGWPEAARPMIVSSDNEATTELVALLHRQGAVEMLNERFAELGLHTLQLNATTPAGGWRNGDGSGVGQIHMTAWDTVRLLWLLDEHAPPAPWLPAGTTLLRPATRTHLRQLLAAQQLDTVLSSGSLHALPGWVAGLPDAPAFAHKTGNTENYAADAGIVRTAEAHYIVAFLSNLGQRYAPHPGCNTTWRVPALGAAVHAAMCALS